MARGGPDGHLWVPEFHVDGLAQVLQIIVPVSRGRDGPVDGFLGCGFIELATEPDRLEEYRRVAAFNRKEGVDVQEISAREVRSLFPLCRTDDVLAGFYVEDDGRVNPVDATQALAKGFRLLGGTIVEGVECRFITEDNAVVGLQTSAGTIKTDYVVNCGGLWARELGRQHGVLIPNQAAEHYYLLTDAMENVDPQWPVVEDPRNYAYIRPEGGGLMVGLFEGEAAAFDARYRPSARSSRTGTGWRPTSRRPCRECLRSRTWA